MSSLLENLGASVEVDGEMSLDCFVVGDEEFLTHAPVTFSVTLTNTGVGIVASGTVKAPATATCSRCLESFALMLEGEIEGFYVQPGRDVEIPEEQEVEPIASDNTVDIWPALSAALTLEAPFAPLHDEDCAGLCLTCGCNLNEEACSCLAEDLPTGPLASLRELLEEDEPER